MAVSRKKNKKAAPIDEKALNQIIDKGGSSIKDNRGDSEKEDVKKTVNVILWKSTIQEIDDMLLKIPLKERKKRHAWIIEAIHEKLEKDKKTYD